jgi:sec-independent protein translocase protein TatC
VTQTRTRPDFGDELDDEAGRMPLMEHLRELRRRLLRSVLALVVVALICFFFYSRLFAFITAPLDDIKAEYARRGGTVTLNFQSIGDPFTYAIRICGWSALFLSSPVWLYQLWAFITPGLHKNERRWGLAFIATAVPLFLGGVALAYTFLPQSFGLLIGFNPDPHRVANIIAMDTYLSFVTRMMLIFGVAFVFPVLLVALDLAGVVTARHLLRAWRPVVFGAFVFAAVATPSGDPGTMSALALPMLLLYASATAVCAVLDRRRRRAGTDGIDYEALSDDEASPLDHAPHSVDGD